MVWLVQNYRSNKCLQFLTPPELRCVCVGGGGGNWAPTRALPTTRWGTLSDPRPLVYSRPPPRS